MSIYYTHIFILKQTEKIENNLSNYLTYKKLLDKMKSVQKEKILYLSELDKLPWDILFHIYSFCDSDRKKKIRTHLINIYEISIIISLLVVNFIMYCLGFSITGHYLGFYLLFNILLGYLIIGGLCLFLLFNYICITLIFEVFQN